MVKKIQNNNMDEALQAKAAVVDMIPAMVLVMPLSALWTNYIAPLL